MKIQDCYPSHKYNPLLKSLSYLFRFAFIDLRYLFQLTYLLDVILINVVGTWDWIQKIFTIMELV